VPASVLELTGLFFAGFLSATLLPGSSEAALAALLASGRVDPAVAIAAATVGNTLGSCVNWAIGAFLAHYRDHPRFPVKPEVFDRYGRWYARWGVWSLLLSWAPVIGDPLTVIAGVFRTPFAVFTAVVFAAKLLRYLVVAGVVTLVA
jgi:membrane protein YqaA with SNARE-associated domain